MATSTRISILLILATVACGFPRPADVRDDDDPNTTYQLVALEPATATTGDTITLEGTFDQTATVHFPGGASQPATILGAHRASVVVPATATVGDLNVETGGTTVGPLTFRRASLAIELQPFETPFAQVGGARQRSTLTTGRSGHTAVVVGDSMYVLGGTSGGNYLDSVERALINADGSLGPFTRVPGVAFTTARAGHTSAILGSFLYIFGGSGSTGLLDSIERATIAADGTLGPFAVVSGIVLERARDSAATIVAGNSVYVTGGIGSGVLGTIERAVISPDGSLGPFAIVDGITLSAARSGHSATVVGSALYVLGGAANSTALSSVERAAINPDGSLGPFTAVAGINLQTARSGHTSTFAGNSLYVFGGTNSTGQLNSIEQTTLSPDGSLTPFVTASRIFLGTGRTGHATVFAGTFLYQLGGTSNHIALRSVEQSLINANGSLGSFADASGIALTGARTGHVSVVTGRYLYVLGGNTGGFSQSLKSVERAPINADGSLGPFDLVPDVALTTARSYFTCSVVGNYLYAVGGQQDLGSYLDSVERAPIAADGSLGTFADVSSVRLTRPRLLHTGTVVGDFLYIVGGHFGDAGTTVERAAIGADGSLGRFDIVPGVNPARSQHGSMVVGSFLYVLAGASEPTNGTPVGVDRAAIATDGSLGPFVLAEDAQPLGARVGPATAVFGRAVYVLGGAFQTTVARAIVNLDGSLGPFSTIGKLTAVNIGHTSAVVGNALYILGGSLGGATFSSVERADQR